MGEILPVVPRTPKTEQLRKRYPQSEQEHSRVREMRRRVLPKIGSQAAEFVVTIGPCGPNEDGVRQGVIQHEVERLDRLNAAGSGTLWLYREPDYKPRSRIKDWHGLITTNPELAYQMLQEGSAAGANIAMEISTDPRHLRRNSDLLTLAWKGGRNGTEAALTETLALHDPSLPVAVKNGLDGEIGMALGDVAKIEELRAQAIEEGIGARAVLLYRGGENAKDPRTWEAAYHQAYEATEGRLFVDLAHGTEMAHDPNGKFKKSVRGQRNAGIHLLRIIERTGEAPTGIFMEASDHPGQTDPNMPFDDAIEIAMQLAEARSSALAHAR